jgi:predicted transcriptional regulator
MSISKLNEVIEEDLVIDLEWLKEEFEVLFDSKMRYHSEMDKKIANGVLDFFLVNADVDGNIELLNYLDEIVENIEKKYSILLN